MRGGLAGCNGNAVSAAGLLPAPELVAFVLLPVALPLLLPVALPLLLPTALPLLLPAALPLLLPVALPLLLPAALPLLLPVALPLLLPAALPLPSAGVGTSALAPGVQYIRDGCGP